MGRSYDPRLIESRWSAAWERDGCYRAPDLPDGPKFFNYDSGPFPNGPLHLGHARTYVLGDVTARYQRAQGRSVLYCTEWDAFGLPNELAALRQGMSPAAFTRRWIRTMTSQLRTLGISYDWSRVRATCDPAYYRWTQWLFLKLRGLGFVERRDAELPFCAGCATALSPMQSKDDRCWRCHEPVETRRLPQWFVSLSGHERALLEGLDRLERWSPQARNLVRGLVQSHAGRAGGTWPVSRQRAWGTPIPIVFCEVCGEVPVPADRLPVRLPDGLDWSLGPGALAEHPTFGSTACPGCGRPARRETDTLDCFFDDVWCFLACLVDLDGPPSFRTPRVAAWMPVDRFHSGFDTVAYLHLHRFVAAVLHERGELSTAEPIRDHQGHEMVLARGRKMSTHLGNAVSPSSILRRHGADALRVALLSAAGPRSAIEWRPEGVERAASLLDDVHRLYALAAEAGVGDAAGAPGQGTRSKAAVALRREVRRAIPAIGRFVEEYRPHAAVARLVALFRRTDAFARRRLDSARLSAADAQVLGEVLEAECVALAVFAPHLAEELWHLLGHDDYVVRQRWPVPPQATSTSNGSGSPHSGQDALPARIRAVQT